MFKTFAGDQKRVLGQGFSRRGTKLNRTGDIRKEGLEDLFPKILFTMMIYHEGFDRRSNTCLDNKVLLCFK